MNVITNPVKVKGRTSSTQQGMLETMVKHLYIKRFPQSGDTEVLDKTPERRTMRTREKKPTISRPK